MYSCAQRDRIHVASTHGQQNNPYFLIKLVSLIQKCDMWHICPNIKRDTAVYVTYMPIF